MKRHERLLGHERRILRERDGNQPLQRSGCAYELYDPIEVLSSTGDPRETLRELLTSLPLDAAMREHANKAIAAMDEARLSLVEAAAMEARDGLKMLTRAIENKLARRAPPGKTDS